MANGAGALLFDLPVPGGLSDLFEAAGVAPAPRPVALLSLIRVLHAYAATGAQSRRLSQTIEATLGKATARPSSTSDTVPLPLSPDVWTGTIFKGAVTADRLLYAILRDKSASLLYYGLLSLDAPTLAYFDGHRSLLAAIYDRGVGPFATCARSIHIKDGAVILPGGAAALRAWEDIVGESAAKPDRFVMAVVYGDQGRRAYFLDVVTHLDTAQQAFALAAADPGRNRLVRALYSTVVDFESTFWRFDVWPFARQPVDPAMVLMQVDASPDGRMKPPSGLAFWRAALDGNLSACTKLKAEDATRPADAAWLVARLMREPVENRRVLLNAVLFAQRVFSSSSDANARPTCEIVASFRRFDGLLLAVERIGFSNPDDYLAALRLARALELQVDPQAGVLGAAQVQGMLALLSSLAATSPAGRETARSLTRSLCALASADPSGTRLAEWAHDSLLSRLCRVGESADSCLQAAAAGMRSNGAAPPRIEWEGQRYLVDPASAANLRLSHVRERQAAMPFDVAFKVYTTGVALRKQRISKQTAAEDAAFLQELADRIDTSALTPWRRRAESARSALQRAARQLASASQRPANASADDVLEASQVLVADAWMSFAYAMAIGDADSSFLLAGDPARTHDFGVSSSAPAGLNSLWRLAQEEWQRETGWKIKGSLLGLERACALSWRRRLSIDPIAARPTLDEREVHGLAQSAAALNPFNLTDAGRRSIVDALARGRATLNTVATDPDAFAALAANAGVSEWRVRGAIWAVTHDPAALPDLFALTELLWLGKPELAGEQLDAWGVPSAPFDGSLAVRMPRPHAWEDFAGRGVASMYSHLADLNLRAAVWLDEAALPASLMPGIVSFATWDLTTSAQPVDVDDYLAVSRAAQAIPAERLSDYVSALTTDGTLTPVPKS